MIQVTISDSCIFICTCIPLLMVFVQLTEVFFIYGSRYSVLVVFWFQIISLWSSSASMPLCFLFFYFLRVSEVEGAMGLFHYSTASRKRPEILLSFAEWNMLQFMLLIQDLFKVRFIASFSSHLAYLPLSYFILLTYFINFFIQSYLEKFQLD